MIPAEAFHSIFVASQSCTFSYYCGNDVNQRMDIQLMNSFDLHKLSQYTLNLFNNSTFMKKIICIVVITFLLSHTNSFAQTINLSADSISTLLCKKWEVNYAIMGGMKIGHPSDAAEINLEFNKDKTFLMTSNDSKEKNKEKGTWVYDTKKKTIKLFLNGKNNATIISLKEEELIMLMDTKEATPNDPMELKIVYKIKAK